MYAKYEKYIYSSYGNHGAGTNWIQFYYILYKFLSALRSFIWECPINAVLKVLLKTKNRPVGDKIQKN